MYTISQFPGIYNAINKLNSGNAPGYDGVTKEHIRAAGESLID